MIQDIEKHSLHYLILVLGLFVCFALFVLFKHNQLALVVISAAGSLFYAGWGIIHHALESRLTKIVAFEYISISILVFLVFLTALSI